MTLLPIQVESYSGSKADEMPRRFVWDGRVIEVQGVVDRWYQVQSLPEWPRADRNPQQLHLDFDAGATWEEVDAAHEKVLALGARPLDLEDLLKTAPGA